MKSTNKNSAVKTIVLLLIVFITQIIQASCIESQDYTIGFYLPQNKSIIQTNNNSIEYAGGILKINYGKKQSLIIIENIDVSCRNHISILYREKNSSFRFLLNGEEVKSISSIDINPIELKGNIEKLYTDNLVYDYEITNLPLSQKRLLSLSNIKYQTGPQLTMILLHLDPINYDNACGAASSTTMVTTWTDQGGSSNNGTLTNFTLPTNGSSGWDGPSPSILRFDGTNDYVSIANESSFDFTSNFSVSLWFRPDSVSTLQTLISKWDSNSTKKGWEINVGETASAVTFKVQDSAMGTPKSVSVSSINTATWYHAVAVHSGTTIKLYINAGTPASTSATLCRTNNNNINIGRESGTAINYFDGSIGNVRIYNTALTASEVSEIYALDKNGGVCDTVAPTVTTYNPADNATSVSASGNLTLTFDESVQKGTGNITIKKISDNSTVETIDVTTSNVTVSGQTVTIDPSSILPGETALYVNIASGAIKDLSNNSYAGISNNSTWNFTTADATAPTVSSLSPSDNSTDVAINSNLVLTFSESVQKGAGNITIKKTSDDSVIQTINVSDSSVTVSTNMATINPPSDLAESTGVYINIDSGAITDLASNSYTGISNNSTWNFTTIDSTAPTLSSLSPLDGSVNVALNSDLSFTFNEDVQEGVGSITIKKLSDSSTLQTIDITSGDVSFSGSTVMVNPPSNFPDNIGIYVNVASGAIEDLSGNAYTGISNNTTWNFTTIDVTSPTISSVSPLDDATGISLTANLILTFSENIQKGSGSINIKKLSDDSILETIDVSSSTVTVSGAMLTINPSLNFPDSSEIYINISSGAIEDLTGNDFSGISDNSTWNFATIDVTAPTVSSLSPIDGATDVSVSTNLALTFNESVKKGTGSILVKNSSDDSTLETVNVTSSDVTVSGTMVTIDLPVNLPSNTDVYVTLPSGVIKDISNNSYGGILDSATWNFTTIDAINPTLTSASITNDVLELIYDENLNSSSTPSTSDYAVSVNGMIVSISLVSISSNTVTIMLSSSVNFADQVEISYTPGLNPVEDILGNAASSFVDQIVSNETSGGTIDLSSIDEMPTEGFSAPSLPSEFADLIAITIDPSKVPVIAGSDGSYEIQPSSSLYGDLGVDGDPIIIKVTNTSGDILGTVNATINEASGSKVIVTDTSYSQGLAPGDGYIVLYAGLTPIAKISAQIINNFSNGKFTLDQVAEVKSTLVILNPKKILKMVISGSGFPSLGKKFIVAGEEITSINPVIKITMSPVLNTLIKKITVDENGNIIKITGKLTGTYTGDSKAVVTIITPASMKTRVIDLSTGCVSGSCAYRNQD